MLREIFCSSCSRWSEGSFCQRCSAEKGADAAKRMTKTAAELVADTERSQIVPTLPTRRYEPAVICARCGSAQLTANGKGFGIGKAVLGALVIGPVGLAAGAIGSSKVIITCLKCGNRWRPGN